MGGVALFGVESGGVDGHDTALKCGDIITEDYTEGKRDDGIDEEVRVEEDRISSCKIYGDRTIDNGGQPVRHSGNLVVKEKD